MRRILFLMIVLLVFSAIAVSALDPLREERIDFGHVMRVRSIYTEPENLIPGKSGLLKMTIQNIADFEIYDLRIKLTLPSQMTFLNDISRIKIANLKSGETEELTYNIVALPATAPGIYEAFYTIDYINNIGSERQDNDSFAIVVKSSPNLFAKIEDSEVYEGSPMGEVTVKFVNNDVSDIKFLTVELQDTADYEIISSNKEYIGDLDSDDFESVSFRINVLNDDKKEIILPLDVYYKDSLNENYENTFNVKLEMRSAKELGISTNGKAMIYVFLGFVILIILYVVYRKFKKKKHERR